MTNLFSIFDPHIVILKWFTNWRAAILPILLAPLNFWLIKPRRFITFNLMSKFIHNEFIRTLKPVITPGVGLILISLLTFILLNNFIGLMPYVFTRTSHLVLTLTLALPLWLGYTLVSWALQPTNRLAHLVPIGTPYPLIPFIVVIEIIRAIIRPGALRVRLAANIVAGHLLLRLLRGQARNLRYLLLTGLFFALILLLVLETAVALIQSYVFRVLTSLYVQEINSLNLSTLHKPPH